MTGDPSRPWTAERTVAVDLARRLIGRARPDLDGARIEPIPPGWDSTVHLVDGRWIARFPRRAIAVPGLTTEAGVMRALAAQLPLAVPEPALHDGDGAFPWPFALHRLVPGEAASTRGLDAAGRAAVAAPLAGFLRALHSIDPSVATARGAGPDLLRRMDVEHRAGIVSERLRELGARGLPVDPDPLLEIVADTPRRTGPRPRVVVHGDLDGRHLLLDDEGLLCGVIDWGDVHVGDPAVDLSVVYGFLPPAARASFRRAYGEIDDTTGRLARFRALHGGVVLALYGHDIGDDSITAEGLAMLSHVLDRA